MCLLAFESGIKGCGRRKALLENSPYRDYPSLSPSLNEETPFLFLRARRSVLAVVACSRCLQSGFFGVMRHVGLGLAWRIEAQYTNRFRCQEGRGRVGLHLELGRSLLNDHGVWNRSFRVEAGKLQGATHQRARTVSLLRTGECDMLRPSAETARWSYLRTRALCCVLVVSGLSVQLLPAVAYRANGERSAFESALPVGKEVESHRVP